MNESPHLWSFLLKNECKSVYANMSESEEIILWCDVLICLMRFIFEVLRMTEIKKNFPKGFVAKAVWQDWIVVEARDTGL